MIRTATGTFRTRPNFVPPTTQNIGDVRSVVKGGWTLGATLVERVDLAIPGNAEYAILSYSISARIALGPNANVALGFVCYGKLGKVLGSLIFDGSMDPTTGQGGFPPFDIPTRPLPTDGTTLLTLWDPDVNDAPPFSGNSNSSVQTIPVFAGLSLPLPRKVSLSSGQLLIGLWITPGLLSDAGILGVNEPCVSLSLYNASYTIVYEDGR